MEVVHQFACLEEEEQHGVSHVLLAFLEAVLCQAELWVEQCSSVAFLGASESTSWWQGAGRTWVHQSALQGKI